MDDAYLKEYYGANYQKVVTERVKVVAKMKSDFSKKYPGADITKFSFLATFAKDASLLEKEVFFIVDDNLSIDVELDTFKNNSKMTWYLYQWKRIWSAHGTVQDFEYTKGSLPYTLNEFGIYVTDTDRFFDSEFPKLVTSWDDPKNTGEDVNVSNLEFDYENNPYFAFILAMYLTTYGCGVSMEHLRENSSTPRIITSIARYHVYYHMRRFLRSPAKSLQTQEVFRKLVDDTVIQSTQTLTVAAMRKAIDDTNVVLNMAISPGIILVPSNMTILTEMVAGYNNTLTLAGSGMKFGENTRVNHYETPEAQPPKAVKTTTTPTIPTYKVSEPPTTYKSEMYLLAITTVGGSLISRFLL